MIDNIGSQSTMDHHRTLSFQSGSNTVSKQTIDDLENIDIITSPIEDDKTNDKDIKHNNNNNNNKNKNNTNKHNDKDEASSTSSSSNDSPTVSQVTPLPNILKKKPVHNHTHILKSINHPHNINDLLPRSVTPTSNITTPTSNPNLSTTNLSTQSNTEIIYATPTQTRTNPSSQGIVYTPNMSSLNISGATPSGTIPSSYTQSLPPLRLTNTDTLELRNIESNQSTPAPINHRQLTPAYNNINNKIHIEPTPQHSPDPHHIQHEDNQSIDLMEDDEEKDISNKHNKHNKTRKRASTHDSAGITAIFRGVRANTVIDLFRINRFDHIYIYNYIMIMYTNISGKQKRKITFFFLFCVVVVRNKKGNSSMDPQNIPIADTSNSAQSQSQSPQQTRKRRKTYHSKQQKPNNDEKNNDDNNDNDNNKKKVKFSFGNRLKRSQTLHSLSSLVGFGGSDKNKSNKRSNSVHTNKRNGNDNYIVCKPTSRKLNYVHNTSIQPLESFIMEGNVQGIISILKKYESNYPPFFMEYSNKQGHTLLMRAAFLGHFTMMKYLINRYKKYKNAIFDSVEPSYGKDIAGLLLEYMGDYINYESRGGKSALIFACSCKHKCRLNIVKYLLESGASVAEPKFSKHGKSPLIHAVEWKQQNLIQLLLDYGADVNVQDRNNGFTPLMYAARFNSQDLCDFLLANGADKSIINHNGKTATELAKLDQAWQSLLALDINQIPANVLSLAATSPTKNRWGRDSLSYSYV